VPGRGLRQARLSEVDRVAGGERGGAWGVAARLAAATMRFEIGTGRDPASLRRRAERRLVKMQRRLRGGPSALAEHLGVIWLTPQMDCLFLDSACARRRFSTASVYGIDPIMPAGWRAHEHALQERSQLLRQGGPAAWDASGSAPSSSRSPKAASPSRPARRELVERLGQAWPAA